MRYIVFTLLLALSPIGAEAQQNDKITGVWYNEEKDAKIPVYRNGNKYFGKIIWLKNNTNSDGSTPKLDTKNPDPSRRKNRIEGTIILRNLEWDADDEEWDDGEIYDPKTGNEYSLYAKLQKPDELYLKGYIGFSLIGRSTVWTRVED